MAKSLPRPPKLTEAPPVGGWTEAAPLSHARFDPYYGGPSGGLRLQVLALPDGKVLVRGGHTLNRAMATKHGGKHWLGKPVKEAELWDGAQWRVIPAAMAEELAKGGKETKDERKLPWFIESNERLDAERRSAVHVDLGGGEVLVAGGAFAFSTWDGDETTSVVPSSVVYSAAGWRYAGDVVVARMHGGGVRLPDGRVMFAGGQGDSHENYACVDLWEPMPLDRAAACWASRAFAIELERNAKYPKSLRQGIQGIRDRMLAWSADLRPVFEQGLRDAHAMFGKKIALTVEELLR